MLYADQANETLEENVERGVSRKCQKRQQCKQNFMNTIRRALETCNEQGLEHAFAKLDGELKQVERVIERAVGGNCESCYREVQRLRARLIGLVEAQKVLQEATIPERWSTRQRRPANLEILAERLEGLSHDVVECEVLCRCSCPELSNVRFVPNRPVLDSVPETLSPSMIVVHDYVLADLCELRIVARRGLRIGSSLSIPKSIENLRPCRPNRLNLEIS